MRVPHQARAERRLAFKNGQWGVLPKAKGILKGTWEGVKHVRSNGGIPFEESEGSGLGDAVEQSAPPVPTDRPPLELEYELVIVLCLAASLLRRWFFTRFMSFLMYVLTMPLRLFFLGMLLLLGSDLQSALRDIDREFKAAFG
jgi:hypothetical protein